MPARGPRTALAPRDDHLHLLRQNGADYAMTSPARPSGELRVAVANLEYGGLSDKGDDSDWCKSMACLLDWVPSLN